MAKKKDKSGSGECDEQQFPCTECGKFFKRQAYLRKHMLTHKIKSTESQPPSKRHCDSVGSSSGGSLLHSDNSNSNTSIMDFASNTETTTKYFTTSETFMPSSSPTSSVSSSLSSSSTNKQIYFKFENTFTEEENIAAAALAHLRNGPTVIRHTTALAI